MPQKTSSGGSGRSRSKSSSSSSKKAKLASGGSKKANGEEKVVWYSDRKKESRARNAAAAQQLEGRFPCTMAHWAVGKYKSRKGHVFLMVGHPGGVQLALKERNAGEFFWRSPLEPRVRKGELPGGIQIQPSGYRSLAARDMLPDVADFDALVSSCAEGSPQHEEGEVETLEVGRYRFGRYGFWELRLLDNGTLEVTNTSKSLQGTQYKIMLARFGALSFTDSDGGRHALADQDELDRAKKKRENLHNSEKLKKARANKKKADAQRRSASATKLAKAGSGRRGARRAGAGDGEDEEEGEGGKVGRREMWMCAVCSTRGNVGPVCSTCRCARRFHRGSSPY
jgi:hypothetical protein